LVEKLLIFFEQLEVDYVLLFDLVEENNTSKTIVASGDGIDNSKLIDDETSRKFEKDNKTAGSIY